MIVSKKKLWEILWFCASLILYFINWNLPFSKELEVTNILFLMFINMALIFKFQNKKMLQILFIMMAYFNYSFVVSLYIFPMNFNKDYMYFADSDASILGLGIMNVFLASLYLFSTNIMDEKDLLAPLFEKKNIYISAISSIILILFAIYGSEVTVGTTRGSLSPVFEYSIILYILALYYSNKRNFFIKWLLLVVGGIFILREIISGGRIVTLQFTIAIYIYYISKWLTLPKTIAVGGIGFILLNFIGIIRNKVILSVDLINLSNLIYSVKDLLNEFLALDTSYSAYHTSLTFISVVNSMDISWKFRLHKFFEFIQASLLGRTGDVNISRYTRSYYFHSYGGLLPFHLWFYLGIFGVILGGFVIGKMLSISPSKFSIDKYQTQNGLLSLIYIYVIIRAPRWYLYDPSVITRGILFLGLGYYVFYLLDKLTKSKYVVFDRKEV